MSRHIPCPQPTAEELAHLRHERPVKISGHYVHRYRDEMGRVCYERVTHGYSDTKWYRVEA